MSEKISQLVDAAMGEAQRNETLDSICGCAEQSRKWRNYHLIGQAVRGEVRGGACLGERIARALEDEPTVLAPSALPPSGNRPVADTWRPVGLFAVAASLALVAVVTLQPGESTLSAPQQPLAAVSQPLVPADAPAVTPADSPESSEQERFAQEFDEMLSEHGEFTTTAGLNGLLAYAKLVSNPGLEN